MNSRRWDDMYRRSERAFSGDPNPVLISEIANMPPGRALERASQAEEEVDWVLGDPTTTPPTPGAFDLVTISYFPLRIAPDHAALHGLLHALAAGGTLLFTTHARIDLQRQPAQDFDPADFYQPQEIAAVLNDQWTIEVNEARRRNVPTPAGTHHTHDAALLARRL